MKRTRLIPTLLLPLLLLTACGQESSDFDPADYEHPAYPLRHAQVYRIHSWRYNEGVFQGGAL